jgi:hypothetical protein
VIEEQLHRGILDGGDARYAVDLVAKDEKVLLFRDAVDCVCDPGWERIAVLFS